MNNPVESFDCQVAEHEEAIASPEERSPDFADFLLVIVRGINAAYRASMKGEL